MAAGISTHGPQFSGKKQPLSLNWISAPSSPLELQLEDGKLVAAQQFSGNSIFLRSNAQHLPEEATQDITMAPKAKPAQEPVTAPVPAKKEYVHPSAKHARKQYVSPWYMSFMGSGTGTDVTSVMLL